ncbi:MAG: hypothetical protein QHI38_03000 [Armatimonadota bacterium]|nr:hypothetical protein [Armatimonadota bacterium]
MILPRQVFRKLVFTAFIVGLLGALVGLSVGAADFAARVVDYSNLGAGIYGVPDAVLGPPTKWIKEPGGPGVPSGTYACSMVYGAWNTAPDGSPLIVTIGNTNTPGRIIVEFDPPICDDPANWYGLDFIVFGNAAFVGTGYVRYDTDMATYRVNNNASVTGESVVVAVSPDGTNWYEYSAPTADSYWPTNAFAWNSEAHTWDGELDPTKPVDPALTPSNFAGLYVADAIELYKGSAGGTAYDLAQSGFAWVRYVKLSSKGGEVDALARVRKPLTISEAKNLPDGAVVSLGPSCVTAGSAEFADCCYIQSADRTAAIKVTGRTAEAGCTVLVTGTLDTEAGERVIRASWLGVQQR